MRWMTVPLLLVFLGSAGSDAAEEGFEPARFVSGRPPQLAPMASNGGLVVAELVIAPSGIVEDAIVVDDAPPFTDELTKAIRLWKFDPALEDGEPVRARVSVIALFRAPVLMGGAPPPPGRVSPPSGEVPYPTSTSTPGYPPQALKDGVVMLEALVDENGGVAQVDVLSSDEGFAAVALEAARKFRFEPATRSRRPTRSYAVLVFGFSQPVTPRRSR
jgi:TonB family protein